MKLIATSPPLFWEHIDIGVKITKLSLQLKFLIITIPLPHRVGFSRLVKMYCLFFFYLNIFACQYTLDESAPPLKPNTFKNDDHYVPVCCV